MSISEQSSINKNYKISGTNPKNFPFTLVNSNGNEIAGEQLGLLLYRGGTVCADSNHFNYTAADAICRRMNFTRAKTWKAGNRYDIQRNYYVQIYFVRCSTVEWEKCTYDAGSRDHCAEHNYDVFLNCSNDNEFYTG